MGTQKKIYLVKMEVYAIHHHRNIAWKTWTAETVVSFTVKCRNFAGRSHHKPKFKNQLYFVQEETFNTSLSLINDEFNLRISSFLSVLKHKGMSPSEFSFFQASENPNDNSTAQHFINYGYKQTPPKGSPPTTSISISIQTGKRTQQVSRSRKGKRRKRKKKKRAIIPTKTLNFTTMYNVSFVGWCS